MTLNKFEFNFQFRHSNPKNQTLDFQKRLEMVFGKAKSFGIHFFFQLFLLKLMINKENSEGRSPRSREQTAINVRETTPENSIAIEVSPPRMSFSGSPIKKGPLPAQSTPLDKELNA
jgi:hypothetical protein